MCYGMVLESQRPEFQFHFYPQKSSSPAGAMYFLKVANTEFWLKKSTIKQI